MPRSTVFLGAVASLLLLACQSDSVQTPLPTTPQFGNIGGAPGSVVFRSTRDGNPELYAMDPDGGNQRRLTNTLDVVEMWPDLLPGARYLVYAAAPPGEPDAPPPPPDIYVMDLTTGHVRNLTNTPDDPENRPRWSPNGRQVAFHGRVGKGDSHIWVMNADGSDRRQVTDHWPDSDPDWSPDGRKIVYRTMAPIAPWSHIAIVNVSDGRNLLHFRSGGSAVQDREPAWSPSGRYIAFTSDREGYPAIYLMSADGEGSALNLTPSDVRAPSSAPAWSRDGRHIYFSAAGPGTGANRQIYVMDIDGKNLTPLTRLDNPKVTGEDQPRAR